MIVQCPTCRELITMVEFTAEANVLTFTCSACHAQHRLTGKAAAAPPPSPAAIPPAEPRRVERSVQRETDPTRAWEQLQTRWTDTKAHDAFVATCQAASALPFAGQHYRDWLAAHPEDAMAKRGRDRVLAAALAIAEATRSTDQHDDPIRSTRWIKPVAVAMAAVLGILMLRVFIHTAQGVEAGMEDPGP